MFRSGRSWLERRMEDGGGGGGGRSAAVDAEETRRALFFYSRINVNTSQVPPPAGQIRKCKISILIFQISFKRDSAINVCSVMLPEI